MAPRQPKLLMRLKPLMLPMPPTSKKLPNFPIRLTQRNQQIRQIHLSLRILLSPRNRPSLLTHAPRSVS